MRFNTLGARLIISMASLIPTTQLTLERGTLMIASTTDIASINIASKLLSRHTWQPLRKCSANDNMICNYGEAYTIKSNRGDTLFLWVHESRLLELDEIDKSFFKCFDCNDVYIEDAIFLSRHSAASGTRSLTVHPIGIPWMHEKGLSGGKPGACSPPNFRIAELYRSILNEIKGHHLESEYQVRLGLCSYLRCYFTYVSRR